MERTACLPANSEIIASSKVQKRMVALREGNDWKPCPDYESHSASPLAVLWYDSSSGKIRWWWRESPYYWAAQGLHRLCKCNNNAFLTAF